MNGMVYVEQRDSCI